METDFTYIPAGYHSVTPSLTVLNGAAALDFYVRAFGAEETFRLPDEKSGKLMHAEFKIGNSIMMLSDEFPEWGALAPQEGQGGAFMIYVKDVEAALSQAIAAGATELMPLTDQFWGDRTCRIADPFGYRWSLAQKTRDVAPEDITRLAAEWQGKESA